MSIPVSASILTGSVSNSSTLSQEDLILNAIAKPYVQTLIDRTTQRSLVTLFTTSKNLELALTRPELDNSDKVKLDESKSVSSISYQFKKYGRLSRPTAIISQVGSTNPDGTFQILAKEGNLHQNMMVKFHAQNFWAQVISRTGVAGNYVYTFRSADGRLFDWNTICAGQSGAKTVMGAYTSYPEASEKGHSITVNPDTFIAYTTIQRNQISLTGNYMSQQTWVEFTRQDTGESAKGFFYEPVYNAMLEFNKQNETQKIWGISNMRNADGTHKSEIPKDENGFDMVRGDGLFETVSGANQIVSSGIDGMTTVDDWVDMHNKLNRNSNQIMGSIRVVATGSVGFTHFQMNIAPVLAKLQNVYYVKNIADMKEQGGSIGMTGQTFTRLDFGGNTYFLVLHPQFDDVMHTQYNSYGKNIVSGTYLFLTIQEPMAPTKNIEIMAKRLNGVDRSNVYKVFNGMSGAGDGVAVTTGDYNTFSHLKEDLLVNHKPELCGVIEPAA